MTSTEAVRLVYLRGPNRETVVRYATKQAKEVSKTLHCEVMQAEAWEEVLALTQSDNAHLIVAVTLPQLKRISASKSLYGQLAERAIKIFLILFQEDAREAVIREALVDIKGIRLHFVATEKTLVQKSVHLTSNSSSIKLTPRELEILPLLAEGLSNKQIAKEIHMAPLTVKHHVSRMCRKFGVSDRAGLVYLGLRSGYFT